MPNEVVKLSQSVVSLTRKFRTDSGLIMRHKTPNFAIEIHARALTRRFKHHARIEAESHADRLKQQGDEEGHHVWMDVARRVRELQDGPEYESKN